jgi:hypothetical protein
MVKKLKDEINKLHDKQQLLKLQVAKFQEVKQAEAQMVLNNALKK